MRKYFILLAVVARVALTAYQVVGQTVSKRVIGTDSAEEGLEGYATIVDSTWFKSANPAGAAAYTTVVSPTNQRIHEFWIWSDKVNQAASSDEAFTVRFWTSSTDSTSITASALRIYLNPMAPPYKFPVDCYKVSLTSVGTSDSVKAYAFCK